MLDRDFVSQSFAFWSRVFEFKAAGLAPRDAAVAEPVTATTQNTRSSE